MKQQLIAVILGTDQVGILSDIATLVSESECNILDSRHAIYITHYLRPKLKP